MSIKLVRQGNGIKITLSDGISRGYSIYAENEEEAINSVKHYFMRKHNKRKCPSCKDKS